MPSGARKEDRIEFGEGLARQLGQRVLHDFNTVTEPWKPRYSARANVTLPTHDGGWPLRMSTDDPGGSVRDSG